MAFRVQTPGGLDSLALGLDDRLATLVIADVLAGRTQYRPDSTRTAGYREALTMAVLPRDTASIRQLTRAAGLETPRGLARGRPISPRL